MPRHGVFIRERLNQLANHCDISVVVLRPRLPFGHGVDERLSAELGERSDIEVEYLSVPSFPKMSNWVDPILWANASEKRVRDLAASVAGPVVLDAHFLYPDCVAAVIVGRRLGIPVVASARGSDVNVKCQNTIMRHWIRWAAKHSSALITVSQALAEQLKEHNIEAPRIEVIPNGVDREKFSPKDQLTCRRTFEADGLVLVSAGHLNVEKGHSIAIEALVSLSTATLLIVGEGAELGNLRNLAESLGVATRVRFLGLIPHMQMAAVYSAADFTVLPSLREGMPNVILESIACGTRVAATDVGGVGEVINSPLAGELLASRDADSLVAAIKHLQNTKVGRSETRQYSRRFGWAPMIERQAALYNSVAEAAVKKPLASAADTGA